MYMLLRFSSDITETFAEEVIYQKPLGQESQADMADFTEKQQRTFVAVVQQVSKAQADRL